MDGRRWVEVRVGAGVWGGGVRGWKGVVGAEVTFILQSCSFSCGNQCKYISKKEKLNKRKKRAKL